MFDIGLITGYIFSFAKTVELFNDFIPIILVLVGRTHQDDLPNLNLLKKYYLICKIIL